MVFGIISLVVWIVTDFSFEYNLKDILLICIQGVFSGLAYFLWNYSMTSDRFRLVTFVSFLMPALSVIFLIIFGFSFLSWNLVFSILLILLGIFISKKHI